MGTRSDYHAPAPLDAPTSTGSLTRLFYSIGLVIFVFAPQLIVTAALNHWLLHDWCASAMLTVVITCLLLPFQLFYVTRGTWYALTAPGRFGFVDVAAHTDSRHTKATPVFPAKPVSRSRQSAEESEGETVCYRESEWDEMDWWGTGCYSEQTGTSTTMTTKTPERRHCGIAKRTKPDRSEARSNLSAGIDAAIYFSGQFPAACFDERKIVTWDTPLLAAG